MNINRHGAGRFTPDSDFVWITTKGASIPLNPFDGELLIIDTEVGLRNWYVWRVWEPKDCLVSKAQSTSAARKSPPPGAPGGISHISVNQRLTICSVVECKDDDILIRRETA